MHNEQLQILIADDHSVVRNGIVKSITTWLPNATFSEAGNASEVSNFLLKNTFDLVILDISMPGRSGLDVLKDIKTNFPKLPVIIFSMYPEDQFAIRAIKAGASAYISKDISSIELEKVIKSTLSGKPYFTPSVTALITDELQNKGGKPVHEHLSDREFQVFMMISGGKSVSDIAHELKLSVKTVSVYRAGILSKMNLKNNSEIMYYAFKNKLVY